jgi:cystathionine beta-lyase/cystathionine gamma-synthase
MKELCPGADYFSRLASVLAAGVSGARARLEDFYLDRADGAEAAFAFGSKIAAVNAVLDTIDSGARVLVWADPIAPVSRHFDTIRARTTGVRFERVDASTPEALSGLICEDTRLLWVEQPIGLHRRLPNLAVLGDISRRHEVRLVVDNSAAGLGRCQPLAKGADICLEAGLDDGPAAVMTADQPYLMFARERLRFFRDHGGAPATDAAAFAAMQGLVDAPVRARQQSASADKLAGFLEQHPAVHKIHYPGLASHPDHACLGAEWQAADPKMTIVLDRDLAATTKVVATLQAAGIAAAPGATAGRSFITHVDHLAANRQQIPSPVRLEMGIEDGLLVMSVGVEPADQLWAAFDQALGAS